MSIYIILSRFSPLAFDDVDQFKQLASKTSEKIKSNCPEVIWLNSYATIGRFDVVNIIESDDPKQVEKAAMIIRAFQHSTTETLLATAWNEFVEML